MTDRPITVVVPGDPNQRTGGYLYDAHMVTAMKQAGWTVEVVGLKGAFPDVDETAIDAMTQALMSAPANACVILDGLAMSGFGDRLVEVRKSVRHHHHHHHKQRQHWVGLVHHPLADEQGLSIEQQTALKQKETSALSACDAVLVTSAFTAQRLVDQGYLEHAPEVVIPGVEPAPLADIAQHPKAISEGIRLLTVASLTPRKGHDVLLHALATLKDFDWVCRWVGDAHRDPSHADKLQGLVKELNLEERIEWFGEADEAQLAESYHQAHLSILPSHYEGYGMVVTESLARGVPVITTDGGALRDTLPQGAGLQVSAGAAEPLAQALRKWLVEPELQTALLAGAYNARVELKNWANQGQRFIEALGLDTLD